MECDRCKKSIEFSENKGERFYILNVDIRDTKIGVALDSEEDADQARAISGIESDLCSSML